MGRKIELTGFNLLVLDTLVGAGIIYSALTMSSVL